MTKWQRCYTRSKAALLNDRSIVAANRKLFARFFEYEEYTRPADGAEPIRPGVCGDALCRVPRGIRVQSAQRADEERLVQRQQPALDPNDFSYQYDPIGNRRVAHMTGDPNDPNYTYAANALNQYMQVRLRDVPEQTQTYSYDADGNLVTEFLAADMNCDGVADFKDVNPYVLALSDPNAYNAAYPTCNILNGDINADGVVDFKDTNPFVALLSGGG